LRQLEEIMAERNLRVDYVTIWRWVQRYAPELKPLPSGTPEYKRLVESRRDVLPGGAQVDLFISGRGSTGATIDFLAERHA
jgi:hypothetical protein